MKSASTVVVIYNHVLYTIEYLNSFSIRYKFECMQLIMSFIRSPTFDQFVSISNDKIVKVTLLGGLTCMTIFSMHDILLARTRKKFP